ncbi:branched-chain amino acid ABC transporter permease [Anaerotalea alkaliphila]|uniref:Branched-chain amino acid ABC transporter permease n=1 Tax=Anaerotalea alkaliphila TaxID=2662126 RepID=A0A7X5HTB9_9FIRM|nr:branched-chain amino acid ABC transporter permease [Anaerotalea alkaliphila]NDL66268.1 branched-chain amino acid ABC transporter permease [Anaerotalea alkaliphila]
MTQFIQQMINGLHVGSIYALIALGYTMVYGIVKLINFAHGDILMVGAYVGFFALTAFNLPFGLALLAAMVLSALLGMAIDKVAYKPLRNAPRISALITALGVSMFLQNTFRLLFGANPRKMPAVFNVQPILLGDLRIPPLTIITILLSGACMVGLELIIRFTKTGKAMRGVSEDSKAAKLMGINVDRTISITFAIGSALGAVGGILYSISYYQVEPYMGMMPGLKAFVAAVLGGIGVIPGAMLGGFVIGGVESFTKGYLSTTWADAIVFSILILVLVFKPSGILGKNTKEKV